MKIKTINVGLGATINLGDYQNVKPNAHVEIELDANDDINQAFDEAWKIVTDQIKAQWNSVVS